MPLGQQFALQNSAVISFVRFDTQKSSFTYFLFFKMNYGSNILNGTVL